MSRYIHNKNRGIALFCGKKEREDMKKEDARPAFLLPAFAEQDLLERVTLLSR